ncbi:hypothetical protein I4U23_012649 [Adineta vaga]|nr:hypothetical protein I4U23_012649 [Adineta vaga]
MASFSTGEVNHTNKQMQQNFVVISWNVLHMIHEINYVYDSSPVINRYAIKENWSNEKLRLNDIIKTLNDLLIKYCSMECFICLQEVPGDLLPLLNQMLNSHVGSTLSNKPMFHLNTYSRIPKVRGQIKGPLYNDPNESLVTIHYDPTGASSNDQIYWTPCPADPGKGALTVITSSGLCVINTHVPFEDQASMSLLQNISWPADNSFFVLVGDMNCKYNVFMKKIGAFTYGKVSSGLLGSITTNKPTRVGLNANGIRTQHWIDHYLVSASLNELAMSPALVHDEIGDISDHFPISLQFNCA